MAVCSTLSSSGLTRALILFRIGPSPSFNGELPGLLGQPFTPLAIFFAHLPRKSSNSGLSGVAGE